MKMDPERLNKLWLTHNSKLFFQPIIPFISDYLISADKLAGKLLDIGCGYGEKTNALSKLGFDVTGIDYDADKLKSAKENYPSVNFRYYYIKDQLPFGDNSFDVIFSNSVFQYIEHASIIGECKRILNPGGCIIMVENLKNNPITKIGRGYRKTTGHSYRSYPFNHFTYREVNALKNEFTNVALKYFHFLTPLSHLWLFKNFYSMFHNTDRLILQYPVVQRYSWISMFAGINNK